MGTDGPEQCIRVQPQMTTRRGIIAGGNWIVDHVKVIDRWPERDGLAYVLAETASNGGAPYNLLIDLARLGVAFPLAAVGRVGDDEDGRRILADCAEHGIDSTQLRTTREAPTSVTDVMTERATGRRTFFHQRGANALLAAEHFDFQRTQARIFHLGYLLLLDALDAPAPDGRPHAAELLARARTAGLLTSLDCVSENSRRCETVVMPVLPFVDVLFVNDFEAEQLTGRKLGRGGELDRAAVEAAVRQLLAGGVQRWVIVHFPEGACAGSRDGELCWQPSVRVPGDRIAGTAGAGDAFAAGVLTGLHEEWTLPRCLELGVSVAAASVHRATCSEAVRPIAECMELARSYGFRSL